MHRYATSPLCLLARNYRVLAGYITTIHYLTVYITTLQTEFVQLVHSNYDLHPRNSPW
jgi:hypothetical protein